MKLKYSAVESVHLRYVAVCVCAHAHACANVNQFDFVCDMKSFTVSYDNMMLVV